MALVPKAINDKISFFTSRAQTWIDHAEQIGLTAEETAELAALADQAKTLLREQGEAQTAAQSATGRLHTSVDKLANSGAALIQKIRAYARQAGDSVYPLASLPPPADPSPMAEPGKPTDLKVKLDGDGSLKLTWSCKNPRGSTGTMYQIWRSVAAQGAPAGKDEFLGVVGKKKFVDYFPPGTAMINYTIRAFRSTKVGPAATFPVPVGAIAKTRNVQPKAAAA